MTHRVLLLLLFIVAILIVNGCGSGKNFSLEAEEGTQIRIYEVFGMDCPGCHGGLEKLINKLPGVLNSQANWKDKRLAVKLHQDTKLTDEDIFEAIKRANFTPGKRLN